MPELLQSLKRSDTSLSTDQLSCINPSDHPDLWIIPEGLLSPLAEEIPIGRLEELVQKVIDETQPVGSGPGKDDRRLAIERLLIPGVYDALGPIPLDIASDPEMWAFLSCGSRIVIHRWRSGGSTNGKRFLGDINRNALARC